MLPNSYLAVAPDAEDAYGKEMLAEDIAKGLRRINPRLCIPTPEQWGDRWYPGKGLKLTSIWLGDPKVGKKICGFRLGAIPEFTQMGPKGELLCTGWRRVFAKCISARVATQAQIEREFKVVLVSDGRDGSCSQCRREGRFTKATSKNRKCDVHDRIMKIVQKAKERKKERQWLRSQPRKTPTNRVYPIAL